MGPEVFGEVGGGVLVVVAEVANDRSDGLFGLLAVFVDPIGPVWCGARTVVIVVREDVVVGTPWLW
jgi:hypothetical protein